MTGVVQSDYSPRKGKENKNVSNHIPVPRKNTKNNSDRTPKKEIGPMVVSSNKTTPQQQHDDKKSKEDAAKDTAAEDSSSSSSTSHRSVRPQTKILRRPTPNLKHPVIQVESDDGSSDKSHKEDDNPKRQKMGSDNGSNSSDGGSGSNKRKNFIMYNKHNVDKNSVKERTSATTAPAPAPAIIPNPCNSCSRSQAPERLHSHARRDSRGLMLRRSPPAQDVTKMVTSPQKKKLEGVVVAKVKEVKSSPSSPSCPKEDGKQGPASAASSPRRVVVPPPPPPKNKVPPASVVDSDVEPKVPPPPVKDFEEPSKACYICQKEFKVSSLFLHESKCLETWKKTNNSLMPNLRQLPPRRPDDSFPVVAPASPTDEEEGDPAWSAVQSQLIPCPLCGRTFFPERLPVHRRVCKGKQSPRPLKRASSLREQQSPSLMDGEESKPSPLYMPCFVCSRSYGSWVLPMHEQQCLKKRNKENEKLADEERREEPQKMSPSTDDDVASLAELGDNAWESHLQQLVPCPRCSRTFFPDRLEIHERSCKGPSCNRRPRSNKGI